MTSGSNELWLIKFMRSYYALHLAVYSYTLQLDYSTIFQWTVDGATGVHGAHVTQIVLEECKNEPGPATIHL